jgi:DNA repair protein RadD
VERIEHELQTHRRVIAASPCGTGKTLLAMQLMWNARQRGETSMFLAPRRELLRQACKKLDQWAAFGYGMIQACERGGGNLYLPIQVASVDTLVSRVIKRKRLVLPPIRNVFVDECHMYTTQLRTQLLELFPEANVVGFTATPARHDGRALAINFEKLIEVTSIREAIRGGYLVPSWHKAPSRPDLAHMKKVAADYNQKQLDERMEPLMGGIIESWLQWGADRRTLVFANSVARSVWLAEQFRAHGVAAEHCDGTADPTYRDAVFERLESGETQVLCNCDLAVYGFDLPAVSCIVNAKPTLSLVKYKQMLGRGARRDLVNGKENFLVLDHAGAVYEHGYYEDEYHWSLEGLRSFTTTRRRVSPARKEKRLSLRCPKCATVFCGSLTCPECKYFFERTAQSFRVVDGELVEVKKAEVDAGLIEKRIFHAELLGYAKAKGYKSGWAGYQYQSRYKQMPPEQWRWDKPAAPSIATERYLKFLTIRRAKARQKRAVS